MSDQPLSQSLSISGGQLNHVQIGGQAGRDLQVHQTQSQGSTEVPDQGEVIDLLQQLITLVQRADLPEPEQQKAQRHLEMAQEEVRQDDPDKPFALKNLQRATQVFKTATDTVAAGQGLGDQVGAIAGRLAPWFGVAAKTLLLL